MQAIQTKYLGPTNHNGSRVKARCQSGSIIVNWNYELSIDDNHKQAALQLIKKLKWNNTILGYGVLHDETYAWLMK